MNQGVSRPNPPVLSNGWLNCFTWFDPRKNALVSHDAVPTLYKALGEDLSFQHTYDPAILKRNHEFEASGKEWATNVKRLCFENSDDVAVVDLLKTLENRKVPNSLEQMLEEENLDARKWLAERPLDRGKEFLADHNARVEKGEILTIWI